MSTHKFPATNAALEAAPPAPTAPASPADADDAPLTPAEEKEYARCNKLLDKMEKSMLAGGELLVTISDKRLYRAEYPTFIAYLAGRRPNIHKSRAYQLMDWARLNAAVSSTIGGQIPNERQARQLAKDMTQGDETVKQFKEKLRTMSESEKLKRTNKAHQKAQARRKKVERQDTRADCLGVLGDIERRLGAFKKKYAGKLVDVADELDGLVAQALGLTEKMRDAVKRSAEAA